MKYSMRKRSCQNDGFTISNDGATLIGLLDIAHPAAKTLVDIFKQGTSRILWMHKDE